MRKLNLFILICVFGISFSYSQNEETLKAIDNQIWKPFTIAFETHNYSLFGKLHTDDLVRISGDGKRVQGKETYIAGYKERWSNSSSKQTISFRFLERLHDNNAASERGIYKLSLNPNTEQEQNYYGKFHVILRQINGVWKIAVDYDSSEGNSINQDSYNKAFAIDDYDKY